MAYSAGIEAYLKRESAILLIDCFAFIVDMR